jgi:CRP/FNR family cyclic AMP-dependent transcriptional regulator
MEPANVLKSVYLFRGATAEDLTAVAAIAERKMYIVSDCIYQPGDMADAVFVIESGTIEVIFKDKDLPVATVGSGQALGELAFLDRQDRIASAFALEISNVLRLPFAKLDRVFADRPSLAMGFYRHAGAFAARLLRASAPELNRRYF